MYPQPTNGPGKWEPPKNHQILLASRPSGEPSQDNFQPAETEIPRPDSGQMLLRTIYLSLDPYMRENRSPARPSSSLRLPAPSVRWSARSPRSKAVGSSASRGANRNVASFRTNSDLMPALHNILTLS